MKEQRWHLNGNASFQYGTINWICLIMNELLSDYGCQFRSLITLHLMPNKYDRVLPRGEVDARYDDQLLNIFNEISMQMLLSDVVIIRDGRPLLIDRATGANYSGPKTWFPLSRCDDAARALLHAMGK